ncbi:MAG: pantoate--beta-alanine ligase [Candidatus Omnitrophica bacterium]|nr:pantoate--beta-alanine ligase [Candidatus Omnitrophota bacterium]
MKLIRAISQMQQWSRQARRRGRTIGFVPTMGALHAGHRSLIRRSAAECDTTVVSLFVNPTQFGPQGDFARYPRDLAGDRRLAAAAGADLLFAPSVEAIHPPGGSTVVEVQGMSDRLCGAFRPGHFRGVATVVTKLFNIVQPDRAYFGQKDAQQAAIVRRMVRDLHWPMTIRVLPIARDRDGLALSSRNRYLSALERRSATRLHAALRQAAQLTHDGVREPAAIQSGLREALGGDPAIRLEYVEVVDPETCEPVCTMDDRTLVAVAAWVGQTRLIDNVIVTPVKRKLARNISHQSPVTSH